MVNYHSDEYRENKINKLGKSERGVTLILVTLILVISSILALVIITSYQTAALTSEVEAYKTQALHLAEAGINQVIQKIRNNETNIPNPFTGTYTYFQGQPGSYTGRFSVTRSVSGNDTILEAEAIVPWEQSRQAKRVLRVRFNSSFQITHWEELTKER